MSLYNYFCLVQIFFTLYKYFPCTNSFHLVQIYFCALIEKKQKNKKMYTNNPNEKHETLSLIKCLQFIFSFILQFCFLTFTINSILSSRSLIKLMKWCTFLYNGLNNAISFVLCVNHEPWFYLAFKICLTIAPCIFYIVEKIAKAESKNVFKEK